MVSEMTLEEDTWNSGLGGVPIIVLISGNSRNENFSLATSLMTELNKRGFESIIKSFSYVIGSVAVNFGWDEKYNERGKELIDGVKKVGICYDKHIWVDKLLESIEGDNFFIPDVAIVDDWYSPDDADYLDSNPFYKTYKIRLKTTSPNNETDHHLLDKYDKIDMHLSSGGNGDFHDAVDKIINHLLML